MRAIDADALTEDCKRYLGTLNPDRDGKECTRIHWLIGVLENAPTIDPESCGDAVSREAVSSWLKQYGQDVLHGKYKFSLMYIWKNLMDLPSVQPEIIHCRDCKHHWTHSSMDAFPREICDLDQTFYDSNIDYCSLAERRTDELGDS